MSVENVACVLLDIRNYCSQLMDTATGGGVNLEWTGEHKKVGNKNCATTQPLDNNIHNKIFFEPDHDRGKWQW